MIDQARAWSEAEGGTLREYLEWARLQASETARVAEAVLPETDDDSVRIMTIHAAKGLEFPITILSGMTTAVRGATTRVEVTFPPDGPLGIKVGTNTVTPEFEDFQPVDEQMDYHERLRLLYVACTRAKDHLVVSLHRKARRTVHGQAELLHQRRARRRRLRRGAAPGRPRAPPGRCARRVRRRRDGPGAPAAG